MQRPACPTTPSHFASPNIGRSQGESRPQCTHTHTHTHTARQHKREKQTRDRILKLQVSIRVEAGTGKRTKNGYRTKRRKTRTWVGSEHKHALLISSFLSPRGRNKEARRKMNRGNRKETSSRATDPSIASQETGKQAKGPEELGDSGGRA